MRPPNRAPLSPELILRLQVTVGNRAVQRLIEGKPPEEQPAPVPEPEPPRRSGWWRRRIGRIATVFRIRRLRAERASTAQQGQV